MANATDVSDRNQALLAWYEVNQRDLPWRQSTDPYLVLVSETMLQQTQAARVVPAFNAFIERWPEIADLADASSNDVLSAWSGLGYNSRALRLHEAAKRIAAEGWPTTIVGLQTLPGVGPYTANAVAAIAFDETVAAVDTNLRRVLSRWVGEPLSGAALETVAAETVTEPAGAWNQAVMDLGATVCRPRTPKCSECPVRTWCTDPDVYTPPPRQATFEGSKRQLRGAVVRAHLRGEDLQEAGQALGRSEPEVTAVIASLHEEGLLPGTD